MPGMNDFANDFLEATNASISTQMPVYQADQLSPAHYADLYAKVSRRDNPVPFDVTMHGSEAVLTVRNPAGPTAVVMDQRYVNVPTAYFINNRSYREAHEAKYFHVLQYLGSRGNIDSGTMTSLNFHASRSAMTLQNRIQSAAAGQGRSTGSYTAPPYNGYGNGGGQGRGMGR
jgi:hypothetical protein